MTEILASLANVVATLTPWVERHRAQKAANEQSAQLEIEAVQKVLSAMIATKAYLYDKNELQNTSRIHEHELAQRWQEASAAIRQFDHNLAQVSQIKALGWSDPREWENAGRYQEAIKLDNIVSQCEWILSK